MLKLFLWFLHAVKIYICLIYYLLSFLKTYEDSFLLPIFYYFNLKKKAECVRFFFFFKHTLDWVTIRVVFFLHLGDYLEFLRVVRYLIFLNFVYTN